MPKVSVIVPVYGVEKYMERCARSLFEQTLDDIQYLFIDDCTPDGSIEILRTVMEEYPQRTEQVVIHRMEQNSGQAKVRKWGMKNATGEYVIHCDSDDWVDTDMYRAMYEKAKEEYADVVVCDYCVHNGIEQIDFFKGCKTTKKEHFVKDMIFQKISWALWNKLFSIKCVNGIEYPEYNMAEDLAMTAQMILKCDKISYLSKPYYFYYLNTNSITRKLTIDTIMYNYWSTKGNTDIVLKKYKENKWKGMKSCLLYMLYNVVSNLFPIYHEAEYRRLSNEQYPNLFRKCIMDIHFPLKHKFIILSVLLGIYPHKIK